MDFEQMDIQHRLLRGIVETMRIKPFYGHIIQQFQKVYVTNPNRINTAAVGRVPGDRFIKLYMNEDYFNWLFDSEIKKSVEQGKSDVITCRKKGHIQGWKYMIGALEHEILHVALGHIFQNWPDHKRANIAMDCVVNSYLDDENLHESWITPERYGLEKHKSVPWYYKELGKNPQYKKDLQDGLFSKDGVYGYISSSHALWDDVRDDRMAREFIKDIIRKSKDLCKSGYGKMPGNLMTQIETWLEPKKPKLKWSQIVRMFCASQISSELSYTMKRESKRFGTRPGTRKGDTLSLALIVDTSGSMSDHEIRLFWNELWWLQKNSEVSIDVYEADTAVHGPTKYRGKWDGTVHGRGGTCFDDALVAVEGNYDAAIYFTDGQAPKVKRRYRIPTLWVLTTEMEESEYPDPWGKYVKIDIDENEEEVA